MDLNFPGGFALEIVLLILVTDLIFPKTTVSFKLC